MSTKNIILVNHQDKPIGQIDKYNAHKYALLHRAFSVLVFRKHKNRLETLLQRRHLDKYHGGGLWTNACCSHPQPGVGMKEAASSRLKFEMGLTLPLKKVGKFHYVAKFPNGMFENEIDHVFIAKDNGNRVIINHEEVSSFKWVEVSHLQKSLRQFPQKYSPWFTQALSMALTYIKKNKIKF